MNRKHPTPQLISLVGFAATQWAESQIGNSQHQNHYRRVIAAGLAVHENCDLYASAPTMRRALTAIAKHAKVAV